MKIKHSKYKNTGILFELLVRQITADTLKGGDSPAIDLLKKYFVKSELGRDYKLYESVIKSKVINESRANLLINSILENSKKLNRTLLKKQKYSLISEIRQHYSLEEFFGSKVKSYKELASLYVLMESRNSKKFLDTQQEVNNKITLLEHLTKQPIVKQQSDNIIEEFSNQDKDVRTLTYKMLLERFNDKYDSLSKEQKQVLKEFINSVDSTPALRNFYNDKIHLLKEKLSKLSNNITNKATQIKVNEISKLLTEVSKTDKISSDNLVDLLQYYELVQEIKVAHAV